MKTNIMPHITVACFSALLTVAATRARADAPAAPQKPEKTYTGTIKSVDAKERLVKVKGFLFSKSFHLGDHCTLALGDKKDASVGDLHPGQKVVVGYEDASGVLVADCISQKKLRFRGTVQAFDRPNRRLIVKNHLGSAKTFQVADDCKVTIHDGKQGSWDDVKAGHKVTVGYETPGNGLVARQIEQKSLTFRGTLSAIDMPEKTVKAGQLLGSKKFVLTEGCSIIIAGKPDAQLSDLRLGDNFNISYETVNGVNVATRIERMAGPARTETAASQK